MPHHRLPARTAFAAAGSLLVVAAIAGVHSVPGERPLAGGATRALTARRL